MAMLPALILFGDIIGIICAFTFNILMGVNWYIYIKNTLLYVEVWDVVTGLIKGGVFGVVIAQIGCWQGLKTRGGAEGVGRATTRTMVTAAILVLILNFFISKALPGDLNI